MNHRRRATQTALIALGAAALAGCSTYSPGGASSRSSQEMAMAPAEAPVLVLGAGDSLGRAIRTNDIVLAAKLESDRHSGAVVSADDDEN